MTAEKAIPPPIFRHEPVDMGGLEDLVKGWEDHGKLPKLGLKEVVVGPDAILKLPAVLEGLSPEPLGEVVFVVDGTPMRRGGEDLKPMVRRLLEREGFEVRVVALGGDERGVVHPDFREVETVKGNIRPGVPVVALGSGVITDIAKHACFTYEQEHPNELRVPLASAKRPTPRPPSPRGWR